MKRKILNIFLIMILCLQYTLTFMPNISNAVEFEFEDLEPPLEEDGIKRAKMDYFETEVNAKIKSNIENATGRYEYSVRGQENTILDNQNNLNLIYYDDNYVYIQKLDSNNKKAELLNIQKRKPIYGTTIIDNNGNYYIAWGDNDTNAIGTGKVTFEIAKYNNAGKFVKAYQVDNSRSGAGTMNIFYRATCNMAISNGILAYDYGKQGKDGHQTNISGYVDINTMEAPEYYKDYPYTSHAFFTDVISASDNGEFAFVEQGDAYPRAYKFSYVSKQSNNNYYLALSKEIFHFREGPHEDFGYNTTMANYGGMINLKDSIAFVATSEKTLSLEPAPSSSNESKNVFIQIIKKSSAKINKSADASCFVTTGERKAIGKRTQVSSGNIQYFLDSGTTDYGVKWLTNYSGDYTASNVKIVKVDNEGIAIFWKKAPYENNKITEQCDVYYMVLNSDGTVRQSETLLEMGSLPGGESPIYKDGYVYFTNSNGTNKLVTYRVKLYEVYDGIQNRTQIKIPYTSKRVESLDTFKIDATVTNGGKPAYKSGDESILTVSEDGTVTPIKNGSTVVTVSAANAPRITPKKIGITVSIKAEFITIDKTDLDISFNTSGYNSRQTLTATVTPDYADIEWFSSNDSIAKVEQSTSNPKVAYITPVSPGFCFIWASGTNGIGAASATCNVDISVKPKRIEILGDYTKEMAKGETYQLEYTLEPVDTTNKAVKWVSSSPEVATVDQNGLVEAKTDGRTQITVTSREDSSVYDTCYIEVEGIASSEYKYEILSDGTINLLKYLGNKQDIIIPTKIDGYTVTCIDSDVYGEYDNINKTIKSIKIPETVTKIKTGAFSYCEGLTQITIPKNVTSIGNSILRGCTNITEIKVDSQNTTYMALDGILYEKKMGKPYILTAYPEGKKDTSYTTPKTLESLEWWSIINNKYLKEIYVLSNVNELGVNAFYNLPNLEKLYILNSNITFRDLESYSTAIRECPKLTIYGIAGSTAQTYADKYSIKFIPFSAKITNITTSNSEITLNKEDETISIKEFIDIKPIYATNTTFTYTSDNTNIVTVSTTGVVEAVNNGTTKVHIKTTDGSNLETVINVTVDIKCTRITARNSPMKVYSKEPQTTYAQALPDKAKNKVLDYSIKDTSIATIDKNGYVTAIKNGTTTIVIKTTDGSNIVKEIELIVSNIPEETKPPKFMLGDVTEDGKINTDDARAVLLYYMKKQEFTETQKLEADVTGDKKINTDDARQILLYYMKKITKF